MVKLPFIDKYGRMMYCDEKQAFVRQKGYIIIKKDSDIMCDYDAATELFSLPSSAEIELQAQPTFDFTVLAYLYDNNRPIKETQTYRFYDVADADLGETPLHWCSINDIIIKKIMLNATQLIGIKNMLVRINNNE